MNYGMPYNKERPNEKLKPDKFARFYYHLTENDSWGEEITLYPLEGNNGNRAWEEPKNARTCVAPSIAHCLSAITYGECSEYNVYRTRDKVIAHWPYLVEDAIVTRERWLITEQVFIKVGRLHVLTYIENKSLPEEMAFNGECGSCETLDNQRKKLNKWKEILKIGKDTFELIPMEKKDELQAIV